MAMATAVGAGGAGGRGTCEAKAVPSMVGSGWT